MGDETRIAAELEALEHGTGFLPLADAGLLRVTGPAHRDVLQRVLSQDLRPLAPGRGCLALLLAPKGQFRAIMAVFADAEDTLLLVPPGRAGEVAGPLRRYLALSRCDVQPVRDRGGASAVAGARWVEAASSLGADADLLSAGGWHAAAVDGEPVSWFGRSLLGVGGAIAVGAAEKVRSALRAAGARPVTAEAVELERIRGGTPAWGAELTESVLPPEVGIEGEAISYSKGCYVGQETMARMQTYGRPTRALVGLRQLAGEPGPPTLPLALVRAGEDRSRGALTSWGRHPELGGVGMALVRTELAAPGTRVAGAGWEFEVTPFPLW